jgi:predicted PurR-regulated permease PerM
VIREVQEYLGIKTAVSLATGFLIGLLAWLLGLDFPILLGLIGFVMNYIPTVGSILAAVPALVLSLLQFGTLGHLLAVTTAYVIINTVFGNIIEPNLMGRRLGLSTLVVILSLLFWAWLWGPVGALLAVPLTMVVKIMLENTEDLRWIAVLLDKSPPQAIGALGTASVAAPESAGSPGEMGAA